MAMPIDPGYPDRMLPRAGSFVTFKRARDRSLIFSRSHCASLTPGGDDRLDHLGSQRFVVSGAPGGRGALLQDFGEIRSGLLGALKSLVNQRPGAP